MVPFPKKGTAEGGLCTTDPGAPLASTSTVHVLARWQRGVHCGTVELGQGAKTVMSQSSRGIARAARPGHDPAHRYRIQPFDRSTGSMSLDHRSWQAVELAGSDVAGKSLSWQRIILNAPRMPLRLKMAKRSPVVRKIAYAN